MKKVVERKTTDKDEKVLKKRLFSSQMKSYLLLLTVDQMKNFGFIDLPMIRRVECINMMMEKAV